MEVRGVRPFFGLENCRQSSWLRCDAPILTVPYRHRHRHRRPRRSRLRTFRKSLFVPSLPTIHIFGPSDFRRSRLEGALVGGGARFTCIEDGRCATVTQTQEGRKFSVSGIDRLTTYCVRFLSRQGGVFIAYCQCLVLKGCL